MEGLFLLDYCGAFFLTGFLGFDMLLKGHLYAESQIFASSCAACMFTPCVYHTVARYVAVLAFYLGLFKEEPGGEGMGWKEMSRARETVSSLLTSACHRGPLGVCHSLPLSCCHEPSPEPPLFPF